MTPVRFWSDELVYGWRVIRRSLRPGQASAPRLIAGSLVLATLDLALFVAVESIGLSMVAAHIVSFSCIMAIGLVLIPNSWVNADARPRQQPRRLGAIGLSLVAALLVLFLRGGVLASLTQIAGWGSTAAMIPVVLFTALLVQSGRTIFGVIGRGGAGADISRWHVAALLLILYSLALRLVYLGVPNLIPEEAYYWNYAQHLDWGYLDHPPMVAWIIKLGTLAFGNTEFGVRIGAVICWLAASGFAYAFARELLGRRAAMGVMLLLATLPFYFGAGCLMMPDAPLTACWAGAVYFLSRALIQNRVAAWLGAGACIGLGMLSKYTIGLLVPATLLYLLIDSRSRRWLTRWEPYAAALLAALLFLPVVYWNATHEWASFVFQTARRINEPSVFSLHTLLGEIMVLLTPTVLVGIIAVLLARGDWRGRLSHMIEAGRRRKMVLAFTLTTLVVVTVFSLTHEPKLNWTGPTWLVAIPFAAWVMLPLRGGVPALTVILRKCWMPTIVTMMLFFGAMFHYLALGFPGVPYPRATRDIAGWEELQKQVLMIREAVRASGDEPLIAGFDKYNMSSELAFYGAPEGPAYAAGQNLFGEPGLMYGFWFPAEAQSGRTIIIVSRHRDWLDGEKVVPRFDSLSTISVLPVTLNGQMLGEYYSRVGFVYRVPAP